MPLGDGKRSRAHHNFIRYWYWQSHRLACSKFRTRTTLFVSEQPGWFTLAEVLTKERPVQSDKSDGSHVQRHSPKQKKQYKAPHFTVLTTRQARAKLVERALPRSADVERLFSLIRS